MLVHLQYNLAYVGLPSIIKSLAVPNSLGAPNEKLGGLLKSDSGMRGTPPRDKGEKKRLLWAKIN